MTLEQLKFKAARWSALLIQKHCRGLTALELAEFERLDREVWEEIRRRWPPGFRYRGK